MTAVRLGAGVALGLHAALALMQGALSPSRVLALGVAGVLLLAAGLLARGPAVVRAGAALATAVVFWWAFLEGRLALGSVHAAGLLFAVAGALAHVAFLLVRLGAPRAVKRLALVLAAVGTASFGSEVLVRAFVPVSVYEIVPDRRGEECIVEDGDVTGLTPGFRGEYRHPEFPGLRVEVNGLGLRDGLDETAPAPGERSVLVLGDSFVFGTGVEVADTFHERVEREWERSRDGVVHVYGAGVPGHGQVHAETVLERLAPRLRPDVVVVAVYEGNDFEDNMKLEGRRLGKVPSIEEDEARVAEDRRRGRSQLGLGAFLRGVSRFPYWLGSSSLVQVVIPGLEDRLVARGWIEPFVPSNQFMVGMLKEPPPPPFVAIGRAHLGIVLGRLKDRCAELDARLVVLLVPAALQAEPRRFEQFVQARPAAERPHFARRAFHDRLAASLRASGFDLVDPIDALESASEEGDPPYLREGHWSRTGHRIAAEALFPALERALPR